MKVAADSENSPAGWRSEFEHSSGFPGRQIERIGSPYLIVHVQPQWKHRNELTRDGSGCPCHHDADGEALEVFSGVVVPHDVIPDALSLLEWNGKLARKHHVLRLLPDTEQSFRGRIDVLSAIERHSRHVVKQRHRQQPAARVAHFDAESLRVSLHRPRELIKRMCHRIVRHAMHRVHVHRWHVERPDVERHLMSRSVDVSRRLLRGRLSGAQRQSREYQIAHFVTNSCFVFRESWLCPHLAYIRTVT